MLKVLPKDQPAQSLQSVNSTPSASLSTVEKVTTAVTAILSITMAAASIASAKAFGLFDASSPKPHKSFFVDKVVVQDPPKKEKEKSSNETAYQKFKRKLQEGGRSVIKTAHAHPRITLAVGVSLTLLTAYGAVRYINKPVVTPESPVKTEIKTKTETPESPPKQDSVVNKVSDQSKSENPLPPKTPPSNKPEVEKKPDLVQDLKPVNKQPATQEEKPKLQALPSLSTRTWNQIKENKGKIALGLIAFAALKWFRGKGPSGIYEVNPPPRNRQKTGRGSLGLRQQPPPLDLPPAANATGLTILQQGPHSLALGSQQASSLVTASNGGEAPLSPPVASQSPASVGLGSGSNSPLLAPNNLLLGAPVASSQSALGVDSDAH